MKKQKSLKLNFIMNALLTMSSFIFPLITFPYVSRVLGPTGTGQVNFATSLITYFSMFAQLGIPTYGIKVCAQVRDDHEKLTRTTQELLIINLVMTVISYVAFIIALFAVPKLASDKMLYVITSSTILLTTIGMEWLYKALEQYTYPFYYLQVYWTCCNVYVSAYKERLCYVCGYYSICGKCFIYS